jgi:hypothetical protein
MPENHEKQEQQLYQHTKLTFQQPAIKQQTDTSITGKIATGTYSNDNS